MSSQGESSKFNFPENEVKTLEFWNENAIYQKSLDRRQGEQKYVFFEGPPTANGKPHPGHCLTRAIKDLFPRYKTMKGFYCERKAGWDTHGLPVEVEVCKELGIHSKEDIEAHGVEPFIQKCQASVWQYMQQWEELTQRLGFWVKLDEAYVTYHQSYVESVWWSLKSLFDRNLLYEGHKIIWWWAQGGTALSAGEVGQGYKTVRDPSVYVRFPLLDEEKFPNTSLLVWTTTPWTLPSNQFAAVKDDIEYAVVYDAEIDHNLIFAKDLVETIAGKLKRELEIKSTMKGSELIGQRYRPPFDYFYKTMGEETGKLVDGGEQHKCWRITQADFVTTDSGTGAVHEAPAFGEVDYELLVAELARFEPGDGPDLICPVMPNGKFSEEVPDFAGMWVKEADKPILRAIKEAGTLYLQEQYEHEYPFCWRADDDPLIQYPRRSWFIKTTDYKDKLLANNQEINWMPDHIKDGRFGNFLESNVDWALSRERYWGTPLPIWKCEATGRYDAVGSYDELLKKPGLTGTEVWESAKAVNPELVEDLKVHKPYIDAITYDSPFEEGARMSRVTEVIDCWYDSGAMPFAQWGYPHQGKEEFEAQFPADFISEALDQTRGWFYSQLAISTMLFGDDEGTEKEVEFPHPYKNCIVLGLMLAEGGVCVKCSKRQSSDVKKCSECGGKVVRKTEKMSKRLKNYRPPNEIFDLYGADALRWYFFANQPPWTSIIYSERAIKESIPEFLLRMWNVYSFFTLYAGIDGFEPSSVSTPGELTHESLTSGEGFRAVDQRSELDRWIISELNRTIAEVTKAMDAYDNYGAARSLNHFVDVLSNWYVRRSRDRFWAKDTKDPSKLDAYWTLYECLATLVKLAAPFVPFITETIWQNLTQAFLDKGVEVPLSVHLCDYPVASDALYDEDLSRRMELLRQIASQGLSARMGAKLKVRQPLSGVTVVLTSDQDQAWLETHAELLKTELNVRDVTFTLDADQYVTYQVVPNFKLLGPRVGKLMPKVKKAFAEADGGVMLAALTADGKTSIEVEGESIELTSEDVEVRLKAKEGWAAAQGAGVVVVLATELTPELVRAGNARDLVRLVQDQRKANDYERTDRIELIVCTDSGELRQAIEENKVYLCGETLADSLIVKALAEAGSDFVELTIGEHVVKLGLSVVKS
jgi:isoleucyl-tRNA synthetase